MGEPERGFGMVSGDVWSRLELNCRGERGRG